MGSRDSRSSRLVGAPPRRSRRVRHRLGLAALTLTSLLVAPLVAPQLAEAQRAPKQPPAPPPAPTPPPAPSAHDPADAAFRRATELLTSRCAALRAAYEHPQTPDRRPELIHELSDCYLIEADLWRADAMRADAERLEAAAVASGIPVEEPPGAVDLIALHRQWLEACTAFEKSLELEPSPGAQIAVALCRLRQDKLASGRQLLEGMLPQMIARAGSGDPFDRNRLELVQALLKEIGRAQPRLLLSVANNPAPDLAINGQSAAPNQPQPLDAGTYRVTARRPTPGGDETSAETTITLEPGGSYTLSLHETPPPPVGNWRRATLGLGGAALGAGLLGAGAWWYSGKRFDDFSDAGGDEEDDRFVCRDQSELETCNSAADDVNTWRTIRTAALISAGSLAAAALVVHFITPEPKPARLQWVPAVDRQQLSLMIQGGF